MKRRMTKVFTAAVITSAITVKSAGTTMDFITNIRIPDTANTGTTAAIATIEIIATIAVGKLNM